VQINVELTPGVARWAYGGVEEDGSDAVVIEAPGGPLDVSDPAVHAAVSAAAATGALTITDGEAMPGAVEPDEVSLERLAVAQEARAPLYEARDRALHRLPRLPEVVMRSREEVEALADEGSSVHRALLRDAPTTIRQEFAVPARSTWRRCASWATRARSITRSWWRGRTGWRRLRRRRSRSGS
jgi:hypothetical protein